MQQQPKAPNFFPESKYKYPSFMMDSVGNTSGMTASDIDSRLCSIIMEKVQPAFKEAYAKVVDEDKLDFPHDKFYESEMATLRASVGYFLLETGREIGDYNSWATVDNLRLFIRFKIEEKVNKKTELTESTESEG